MRAAFSQYKVETDGKEVVAQHQHQYSQVYEQV